MFRHLSIKAIVIPFIVIVLSMVIYSLWNPLNRGVVADRISVGDQACPKTVNGPS
jgi:hypothetical protein